MTSGIGMKKHGISGTIHRNHTGPKGSNTKRKRKSSRKQRKLKRHTKKNKYK